MIKVYSAIPDSILSNEGLAKNHESWTPKKIYDKTGISERHVCAPEESAYNLAAKAINQAVQEGEGFDFLILCSQSSTYRFPGDAARLTSTQRNLKNVACLDINLGCSGYPYSLAVAKGLLESGVAEKVALVTSDHYSKYCGLNANTMAVFGDAACVSLIDASTAANLDCFVLGSDGSGADLLKKEFDENQALVMKGPEIFNFTLKEIPKMMNQWFELSGETIESVDFFVFHQANAFMLNHLRKKLDVPEEKMPLRLESLGNTVSSSIPLVLEDLSNRGSLKPGTKLCLVGFGVGLSWGACRYVV